MGNTQRLAIYIFAVVFVALLVLDGLGFAPSRLMSQDFIPLVSVIIGILGAIFTFLNLFSQETRDKIGFTSLGLRTIIINLSLLSVSYAIHLLAGWIASRYMAETVTSLVFRATLWAVILAVSWGILWFFIWSENRGKQLEFASSRRRMIIVGLALLSVSYAMHLLAGWIASGYMAETVATLVFRATLWAVFLSVNWGILWILLMPRLIQFIECKLR